ncbi:ROK family transcriptional regulator [Amycolatopsis pigmentata]|uniref:ROK family protein n=1 Tax=Amycolatopsis pigmentata TaxID=450801 RepID=A0ABW5G5M8_9PSEU
MARRTVARLTGLSAAAVTRHCRDLVELGLIREAEEAAVRGGMGRPHVPVDIDVDRHLIGGVHIAHEHFTLAALDLRGRLRASERVPHEGTAPDAVLSAIADRFPAFVEARLSGWTPVAVGVAVGGWVDPQQGIVIEHTSLGWRDIPVGETLGRALGASVRVDNHARALACAERMFGNVRAHGSFAHIFVGNVVDAAIMTGGVPHHGPRSGAGEIAHLPVGEAGVRCSRGHYGCFEATVSDRAWAHRAVADGITTRPSLTALAGRAMAGDRRARELFLDRARMIGRGAAVLFDVLNPEVLVVTELGVLQFADCLEALRDEVAARSNVCADTRTSVVAGSFGVDATLAVAGGSVELDAIYRSPLSLGVVSGRTVPGVPLGGRT